MKDRPSIIRKLHGQMHETILGWREKKTQQRAIAFAYKNSIKMDVEKQEEDYPVDFVVLWLDGNDQNWIAQKEKYLPQDAIIKQSNSAARFRDWDNFQYWFRGVEQYAPWVRYVYLVTWGHVPAFLNLQHPKLKFVRHDQFMPSKYLPTFSCFPTELNIWRLEGICEHIVYFNDDFYLTRPVEKTDFFKNGLPRYCAIPYPVCPTSKMTAWEHNLFNTAGMANDHFDIRKSMENHLEKWFCSAYGKNQRYIMRAFEDGVIYGMYYSHLGVPYRCSTMKTVWEECNERLDKTCKNKFRTMDDVFHQVFQIWEVYNGTFEPVSRDYYGMVHPISKDNIDEFEKAFLSEDYRMICPNDWEGISEEEFFYLKEKLISIMEKKYPKKSSFEN